MAALPCGYTMDYRIDYSCVTTDVSTVFWTVEALPRDNPRSVNPEWKPMRMANRHERRKAKALARRR